MTLLSKDIKLIGVDLGGTKVAAGLISGSEIVKKSYRLLKDRVEDAEAVINLIKEVIDELIDPEVQGIGIGVPSLVDREKGIVYDVQNIPSWKKVPLQQIIGESYNIPVYLDNDANCFAVGELKFGEGKGDDNFVGITIGTGMGSGIITNGHLLQDANCGSGEFGSIPYLDGIYEDYCSGKFFTNHYHTSGKELYKRAENNDPEAIEAFNAFGTHLGKALQTIMFAVDPKKIIIGGSIVQSKKFFHDTMIKTVAAFPYKESVSNLKIAYTNTENIAILGAASLYYDRQTEESIKIPQI